MSPTSRRPSGVVALILAGAVSAPVGAQQAATGAPLVFDGVTIVDVEQGKLVPNQRVIVLGSRGAGARSKAISRRFPDAVRLAIYVAEGLTPLNALQSATINPAKMLRATDSLGTVAAGKLADLVLLDADPLVDITNTTTVRMVVANGRYFDRATLDGLLAEAKGKR